MGGMDGLQSLAGRVLAHEIASFSEAMTKGKVTVEEEKAASACPAPQPAQPAAREMPGERLGATNFRFVRLLPPVLMNSSPHVAPCTLCGDCLADHRDSACETRAPYGLQKPRPAFTVLLARMTS